MQKWLHTKMFSVLWSHKPVTIKTVEHADWNVTSQPYNHGNQQLEQIWFDVTLQEPRKQSMIHIKL
jgi:hypothetical protein